MSAIATLLQRLSHDAHIRKARLLDRVHHRSESTEWHILIRSNENELAPRVADFLPQLVADFIDVDRVISQKHPLVLINRDHHALFGDLLDSAGLGYADVDA